MDTISSTSSYLWVYISRASIDMDGDDLDFGDAGLKDLLSQGFGKQSKEVNIERQFASSKRVIEPQRKAAAGDSDDDNDDDDDDEDESDEEDEYPVSHELVMKTHEKNVTTITADTAGSRLITGSSDCTMKLHDFSNMTPNTIRAFKSVDPTATRQSADSEVHPVHHVEFNPHSPSQVLVITATPQAKIFSRDGEEQVEFVKGDMYLRDMNNTKGHVSEITTGMWHPGNRNLCVTAGTDSTLRIWDVNVRMRQKEVIVHKSRAAGSAGRTRMTAVAWGSPSQGGNNILVAAAMDGSLVMWSGEGPYARPAAEIRDAHQKDTWTGGVDISADGRTVVTRGGDDTIKLWDTRKFKSPVSSVSHPSTTSQYPNTNIRFSPSNSSSIITGSSTGHLHILNPATLKPELVTPVTPGSALTTVLWHPRLNQIITGSSNAETHVLYNPRTSTAGAVTVMSKAPKRRHIDDDPSLTTDLSQGLSGDSIITPNGVLGSSTAAALSSARGHPQTGLTASGRSRDPRRPHIPTTTPFAKSQPDEEHVRRSIPLSSMRDEDPREALLKYAEKAEKEPLFTNAWRETQPKVIYDERVEDDEEEEAERERKKARRG